MLFIFLCLELLFWNENEADLAIGDCFPNVHQWNTRQWKINHHNFALILLINCFFKKKNYNAGQENSCWIRKESESDCFVARANGECNERDGTFDNYQNCYQFFRDKRGQSMFMYFINPFIASYKWVERMQLRFCNIVNPLFISFSDQIHRCNS